MKKHVWAVVFAVLLLLPVALLTVGALRTAVPRVSIGGQKLDPALCSYKVTYRDGHSVTSGDDIEHRAEDFFVGHENPKALLFDHEIDFGRRVPDPSNVQIFCYNEDGGKPIWSGPLDEYPAGWTIDSFASAVLVVRWHTTARTTATAVYYFE